MLKIVWLELSPTPSSTHTSLLLGNFSIGCLLNTIAYSRLPYWCTSSYIVVIQNILHLFLNPDKLSITRKNQADGVFLEVPHFATLIYRSSKHLVSVFLMTLQRFGMICLMKYVRPLLSTDSERSSKPTSLHKHIHPNF